MPNLSVAVGCQSGTGYFSLTDVASAFTATSFSYTLTGDSGGVVHAGSFLRAELPLELTGLADDTYTIQVTGDGTNDIASVRRTISCSGTGTPGTPGTPATAFAITNLRPTAPTTATGTGSALFDVTGTNGLPFDVYLYRTQIAGQQAGLLSSQLNQTNAVDFPLPALPPGTYNLLVYGRGGVASDIRTFTIAAFVAAPRGGCTDRQATNHDGAATFDDGSCEYLPPPVPEPFFHVPALNPLRFVQVETADGCEVFENPDNTLFCQQARPGQQRRPLFFQPVAYCDPVRLQVLTNFLTVEAVIHRHTDGIVLDTQPLTKVQALQGAAPYLAVELDSAADGNTYVIGAAGGLPASLLAARRVALRLTPGGPVLQYRVLRSGLASATVGNDYLVINRPGTGPVAGYPALSWQLSGPGFNVWEGLLDLSDRDPGTYEVRLHGYDDANHSATAISEPLLLAAAHKNTVVVEYGNGDNAYGTVFAQGYRARLRVPGTFFRQKNAGTLTEHRNSDGSPVVLASTAQRLIPLETYGLPAWYHELIFLATRLDYLRVNGVRGKGVGAYEYPEVRQYPLSAGHVDVEQVEWLGAGNGDDTGANDTGEDFLVLRVGGFLRLRK